MLALKNYSIPLCKTKRETIRVIKDDIFNLYLTIVLLNRVSLKASALSTYTRTSLECPPPLPPPPPNKHLKVK